MCGAASSRCSPSCFRGSIATTPLGRNGRINSRCKRMSTPSRNARCCLRRCLKRCKEPDLAERAMTLLFHFQGPELMHADRHPAGEVAYPIVVLLNAVSRLLALPLEVSYTLPEMLEALGSPFTYRRRDYFHFPLGHGLRAEALHAAWYRGKTENLEEIRPPGAVLSLRRRSSVAERAGTSGANCCSPGRRSSRCRAGRAFAIRSCRASPSSLDMRVCCAVWRSVRRERRRGQRRYCSAR